MTPEEVRYWRVTHGLSQQQLADLLGVHRVTVACWEAATMSPPFYLKLALERLDQLLAPTPEEVPA